LPAGRRDLSLRLERLRADYFYFNPEIEPHARFDDDTRERAYADLLDALTSVLKSANFIELPHAEIDRAHRARVALRVEKRIGKALRNTNLDAAGGWMRILWRYAIRMVR
jgi:hypothetical protein